jgi:hypothetical protein
MDSWNNLGSPSRCKAAIPFIRDQWSASVIRIRYRFANQRIRWIYSFCPFTIRLRDGIRDVSQDERFFTDADSHWHVSSLQNASNEIKYFIDFEKILKSSPKECGRTYKFMMPRWQIKKNDIWSSVAKEMLFENLTDIQCVILWCYNCFWY